jgi:hypothetical protein
MSDVVPVQPWGLVLRVTEDADEGGTGGADVWVQ